MVRLKSSDIEMKYGLLQRRGALQRYLHITRLLVRRYIASEETKRQEEAGITEDDVNEIRQDISSFRYELIDVLRTNGMRTPNLQAGANVVAGRKGKVMERRLMKDFQIGTVETAVKEAFAEADGGKDVFSRLAKAMGKKEKKDWNELARQASVKSDPIGSRQASIKRRQASRRRRVEVENAALFSMDPEMYVVIRIVGSIKNIVVSRSNLFCRLQSCGIQSEIARSNASYSCGLCQIQDQILDQSSNSRGWYS